MSSQPTTPPGAGMTADAFNQILAGKLAAGGPSGANQADLPLIPLWRVRPPSPSADTGRPSGAGSASAADRAIADANPPLAGNVNPIWVNGKPETGNDYSTMNAAEGHWMDMSTEDRLAFAAEAEKSGMWKPSLGADALFGAWAKAVGWAGKYNSLHQDDKSKWLSPFEAASKMSVAGMADENRIHDGFSTESTIQQFTTGQLAGQAKQILQSELGRNPTDSELKAYTLAVNAAARATPQQVVTQQTDNPDGSKSSDRVVTGGIDPNTVIQDMASGSQESADFKAAAQYLPALQQAISGGMQLG